MKKISDVIADFLEEKGIRHVFGMIGGASANIFDAILRKGFTEIICIHHEQAATMAIQTYYKLTGKISAALLTAGGGSSNAITGVSSAWMDSVPCLIFSGNENCQSIQKDNKLRIWGVQGFDSIDMVKNVTKYTTRIMQANKIIHELETAYYYSTSERPGPSWIDIPSDIQATLIQPSELLTFKKPQQKTMLTQTKTKPDMTQIVRKVLDHINQAKRPLLWLGNGIRLANAQNLIKPLLNTLHCPTLMTWSAIDMLDFHHPLNFGHAGIYGLRASNFILQNCDFLLAIGTRLSTYQVGYNDISEFARAAKIVVVDIDPDEANKYADRIDLSIIADAKDFISELLIQAQTISSTSKNAWLIQCQKYTSKYPVVGPEYTDVDGFINSHRFIEKLSTFFKPDQIIVTDMGTALLGAYQALTLTEGQRLMTSTGLGEMGYGLPGAIGASFANNKGEVICLNCDGGMMLNLQELQTIVHHKLPIKIFIFNNDGYLMIKSAQKAIYNGRYVGSDEKSGVSCPNYSSLANAFDIKSYSIKTWEEAEIVLPQIQMANSPIICEIFTHPEQNFVELLRVEQKDGTKVFPPLEDLSPLLPRDELRENMIIGLHKKSENII